MLFKRLSPWCAAVLACTLAVTSARAQTVSFFTNSSYVDTGREGPNMRAALVAAGFTVNDFTGITAADFTAAGTANVIVFPEMERGDLFGDLDAAAQAALQAYVSAGGGIVQANYFPSNNSLPNGLFGWSLVRSGGGTSTLNAGAATGTAFAGGPATLPSSDAVEGVTATSLPGGSLPIYEAGSDVTVFVAPFGAGCYSYLGFDWFEQPTPADWNDVLARAVMECAGTAAVPEPGSVAFLGGLACAGFGVIVRRRKR
jgi:hypothetical protein